MGAKMSILEEIQLTINLAETKEDIEESNWLNSMINKLEEETQEVVDEFAHNLLREPPKIELSLEPQHSIEIIGTYSKKNNKITIFFVYQLANFYFSLTEDLFMKAITLLLIKWTNNKNGSV